MTHKHLRFGFAMCGARPPGAKVSNRMLGVDCSECLAIIAGKRASAKAGSAALISGPTVAAKE